ncbi:MAG TPA: hypothetical protein VLA25_04840 [Methylotenera sp.]|nr:hypothetical protein [Methylotenera sp.]
MFAQIAVGVLLSDGHAEVHGNGVRISLQQEGKNQVYFMFLLKQLYTLGYVASPQAKLYGRTTVIRNRTLYSLNTFSFGSLYWLRELFYDSNGVKLIRPGLELYLTPISLAHAICGDGTWCSYGLALCTNSFTVADNKLLAKMLSNKFGLLCSCHETGAKGQHRIYVHAQSITHLRSLVLPHMPIEMHYKLGVNLEHRPK